MVDELIRGKITPEEGARRLMSRQLRSENEEGTRSQTGLRS